LTEFELNLMRQPCMHLDWNLLASGLLKQAVSGGAVVKSPYPATAKKNTEERQ
jgi:hypothetical protein